jgi:pimeloyl-ACP methyl ester carboxylesterase
VGAVIASAFLVYIATLVAALIWNAVSSALVSRRMAGVETQSQSAATPTLVVTLVHGTWAANAAWLRADSALSRSLLAAFPDHVLRFVPFRWSGRNSVSARFRAGQVLAQKLSAMRQEWPAARHVLVGHSHGGFVALSALRGATTDERIRGVACLSTPFLMARARPMSRLARAGLTVTPALLVAFGCGQAVEHSPLGPIVDRHESLQGAFGLLVLVLAALAWYWTPRAVQALSARVFERMQLPQLEPNQLFVMRAPGDEASAALGAAQILNFAVTRIWDRMSAILDDAIRRGDLWLDLLGRIGWPLHAFNAALVAAAALVAFGVPRTVLSLDTATIICAVLLGVAGVSWGLLLGQSWGKLIGLLLLGVIAAPLPVLLALLAIPFAPELAVVSLVLNVSAEPTPPGVWTVRQLRPEPDAAEDPGTILMHSVAYQDSAAIASLIDWMRARIR